MGRLRDDLLVNRLFFRQALHRLRLGHRFLNRLRNRFGNGLGLGFGLRLRLGFGFGLRLGGLNRFQAGRLLHRHHCLRLRLRKIDPYKQGIRRLFSLAGGYQGAVRPFDENVEVQQE